MRARTWLGGAVSALVLVASPLSASAQVTLDAPARRPEAIIDLATEAGARLVQGQWRYSDVKIIDVEHRSPGPDLRPSGPPNRAYDITPHAGAAGFDDSSWEALPASRLDARKTAGRLAFNWYRIGFNAPNRVVVGRDIRPGQQIQLAVFGMNGPVSSPPGNFIWVRSATLDFYRPEQVGHVTKVRTEVVRADPALDAIVAPGTTLEKVAAGFLFTEGPVWVPRTATTDGYLLFSDPNANTIYRWSRDGQVSVFRTKSGYTGVDIGGYGQPGSNGLTLDREGRLTINEHGNRRVTRLEKTGAVTVMADRYQGKRLNSPNDLVYRSDGALYFTDPPFGLPKFFDDPRKELPYSGVFCLIHGELKLVSTDLAGPNGIAFSPDERYLYVGNWDPSRKVVMRYEVHADGALTNGRVFFDMTAAPGEDALDGIKVDQRGDLYVSGPGGLWIVSPDGKHLGTLRGPEHPHNMAWGDDDGRTLYLAAQTGVYRIRLGVAGARP